MKLEYVIHDKPLFLVVTNVLYNIPAPFLKKKNVIIMVEIKKME